MITTLQTQYVNLFRELYGVMPYSTVRNLTDKTFPAWDSVFELVAAIYKLNQEEVK